ncbi:MAG: hypothetical protein ABL879_19005 [Devosia sp.]
MLWVTAVVALIALLWVASKRQKSQSLPANDLGAIAQRQRTKLDLARTEVNRVVSMAEDLYADPSRAAPPIGIEELQALFEAAMHGKLLTAIDTSTRMVHAVTSPIWVRVICKDRPAARSAIVHECWRLGRGQFAIQRRSVEDSDEAIRSFNDDSQRAFDTLDARGDVDHEKKIVP